MMTRTVSIRVRYGETDQMGIVYHANYAVYCEVARVEFFRQIGLPYSALEDSGIMLPVTELNLKFFRPAVYDELLRIETSMVEIPTGARIKFIYKIFNPKDELLTEAYSELAFIDKTTRRQVRCPNELTKKLNQLKNQ